MVSEHAALDEGRFDLYLVRPGAAWQLLAAATHLRFGWRLGVEKQLIGGAAADCIGTIKFCSITP